MRQPRTVGLAAQPLAEVAHLSRPDLIGQLACQLCATFIEPVDLGTHCPSFRRVREEDVLIVGIPATNCTIKRADTPTASNDTLSPAQSATPGRP